MTNQRISWNAAHDGTDEWNAAHVDGMGFEDWEGFYATLNSRIIANVDVPCFIRNDQMIGN
jgi:hypothetical protein